jgi:hypothetical protein
MGYRDEVIGLFGAILFALIVIAILVFVMCRWTHFMRQSKSSPPMAIRTSSASARDAA